MAALDEEAVIEHAATVARVLKERPGAPCQECRQVQEAARGCRVLQILREGNGCRFFRRCALRQIATKKAQCGPEGAEGIETRNEHRAGTATEKLKPRMDTLRFFCGYLT